MEGHVSEAGGHYYLRNLGYKGRKANMAEGLAGSQKGSRTGKRVRSYNGAA